MSMQPNPDNWPFRTFQGRPLPPAPKPKRQARQPRKQPAGEPAPF